MTVLHDAGREREVARLTAEIDALAPAYDAAYAELGRVLFGELRGSYHAGKHVDEFAAVAALDERVAKLQAQVDELRRQDEEEAKARTCPRCGAVVYDGDNFCMGCALPVGEMGAPDKEGPKPEETTVPAACPACSAPVTGEMAFCSNCGTKLR